MSVTPISVQDAIKQLDRDEDRDFADGMIALLELGHAEPGRDETGKLHFRITPAGEEEARKVARRLTGGAS